MKYNSIHGRRDGNIEVDGDSLVNNSQKCLCLARARGWHHCAAPASELVQPSGAGTASPLPASGLAQRFVAKHGTDVEQIGDFWFHSWETSGWQKIATLFDSGA